MSSVMTVLGPINADDLGLTSMHDHILWDGHRFRTRWEEQLPKESPVTADDPVSLANIGLLQHDMNLCFDALTMRDRDVMTAEVADFGASGGGTLVDMSSVGLRCDPEGIREVSQSTGVHVVATTGFYMNDFWPRKMCGLSSEHYERHMLREIADGIDETGVRPGHIKIAISDLTQDEENALRAAARVSRDTGLSLTVHPGFGIGSGHERIVKMLSEEGASPERVVLAHGQAFIMDSEDFATLVRDPTRGRLRFDRLERLLEQGYTVSIECLGHTWAAESLGWVLETDWQRLATVVHLARAGYGSQLVLGNDVYLKILTRRFGGYGYCRLTAFVVPFLRRIGVSDWDLRRMTVENPARLLCRADG